MSDTTVNQTSSVSPDGDKPDVDQLFGARDVDELFPADYKPTNQPVRNVSPIQDAIFSNPGRAHARILDAFGYGFKQDWGAGEAEHQKMYGEADEYLRKSGVWNDYQKGQRSIIKAANEVLMRPAVSALTAAIPAAKSIMSGAFHGAQQAVVQAGQEVGAPNLAREIAAIPEAFPTGFHEPLGIPHLPEPIARAKELDTIGAGEEGYFGTRAVEPTPLAVEATAAKGEEAVQAEALPGKPADVAPSPAVAAAVPEAPRDVHAVAREIAPETFSEFDALAQKKDTFRRWIGELREAREQDVQAAAPHADAIAKLDAQIAEIQEAKKGGFGKLKSLTERRDALADERDAYIAEHTAGDSVDMAKIRQQLMETDYRMRDLAPDVAKAYRDAAERLPQAETIAPAAAAEEPPPREEAPSAGAAPQTAPAGEAQAQLALGMEPAPQPAARPGASAATPPQLIAATEKVAKKAGQQAAKGPAAAAPEQPTEPPRAETLPIAHAPSIVADVAQKLVKAGRPAEEAEAAAQIVAAYWDTRAARFEGRKGTAAEMYAREAPEVVAGKERPSKAKRELELAQESEFDQAAPNQPRETGIPATAGEMVSSYRNDKAIKANPDYKAAKAGDPDAAFRLVVDTVDKATIEEARRRFGPNAIYAPVIAEEATGHNAIPHAIAAYYADEAGGSVSVEIAQINRAHHTGAGPMERLANPAHFEGAVVPGGKYVIVDDVSVMGSTLASMADHIQRNGGDVVGVVTLANASRTGVLRPSKAHIADIERRYGDEVRSLFKTEPAALTADEVQYIRNFRDADALRAAADASEGKRDARLRAKGVGGKEGQDLAQEAKGRIRVRDEGRNTITLMRSADASTFIHETGHDWLDRMLKDARDPDAPETLKTDASTVLKWLGAESPDAVKTRHHERFARGFETYIMEGRAPSSALARVFATFKSWLTTIYRTVAALKAPISDDIRAVFDRLLAEKPERTIIAPERVTGKAIAERHEGLVETTPAAQSADVADTLRRERDSHAGANLVGEEHATRLENARAGAGEHAPGGPQPSGDADASGAVGGEAGAAGGPRALGAGGSEAAAEGIGAREGRQSERLNKAPTPLLNFLASQGGIKASDALISDLRQALGGKNHYVPGFGQLVRIPKQLSSAAKASGRLEAMSIDRAREAAIEKGLLPEGASINDLLEAIDQEVRGKAVGIEGRPTDPAELAHAEHAFVEGVNDAVREAGGAALSDAERERALEMWRTEGLNDPHAIIERLALETDDAEIAGGAPERLEGIPGWDVVAPGWELAADERAGAPGEGGAVEGPQSQEPGGSAARTRREAQDASPLDANAHLAPPETRLIDKAGNIRLDNLGTPQDVNAVIRQAAAENEDFIGARRGVIPDAEVVKLADALGMDASKLSERKLGEAFNAEQVVAARKLLIQSAKTVHEAMGKAAAGAEADVLAYAEAKARHLMIQQQVAGLTAEAGRALRAFRALEGQQEAAAISAFLQDSTGKTLYQLQREAQLGLKLDTPAQVSKFVADTAKPTWKDMVIEAWMACLLSGPRTHVANLLGNTITSIVRPFETGAAALIGKARNAITGSEDRVLMHEATAEMFGMVQGAREGLVAAAKAFATEEPQLTATLQAEKPHQHAIPGVAGQVIRTPMRLLGAEDEFFKAVAFRADIHRQAYALAVKEGLAPELMRQRVAELVMSPTEEMVANAKKVADYQTFQNQLGKVGRAISAFSNSHPLAKMVVPFVRTPLNLLKYAGERSPLAILGQEARDNLAGKNGAAARDTQIARIALGTFVGITAFQMASSGQITGGGPADKAKRAVMMANGWQPYSVKVGDVYYSYNRLDPFSVNLGVAADAYEIISAAGAEHPDKEHLLSLTFAALTKNILNRTALQGISDLNQAASDPDRYFKNYIKGQIGSFVPAISAQTAQTIDPTVREARTIIDTLKARTPGLSMTLMPKRDIWGEPVVREGGLGPDIASPIAEARLKNDPVNQVLLSAGYYPATLERKIRGIDLTDQQYDDYARIAGRMAKMQLNAFVSTPGIATLPAQVRADKMRQIINSAREAARSMILMQNPDIIQKANEAKTAKFKPETVH